MKAAEFYTDSPENAVNIELVTRDDVEALVKSWPENINRLRVLSQFEGKPGQVFLQTNSEGQFEKAYIGYERDLEYDAVAKAVGQLPAGDYQLEHSISQSAQVVWALSQYRFDEYKKLTTEPRRLYLPDAEAKKILIDSEAVFCVRDLINMPPNEMGPSHLAKALTHLAETYDAQFGQCLGDDLLKHNYPAIHAVGRAAVDMPRLLTLSWGDESHPTIALVGKGVCFDTGGLNLKPGNSMRLMKKDMGGAAQVMGLAQWIMAHNLPVCLKVFIPAVENAVAGNAFRPGDILTMRNGKTVEVDNTDAEGRLVLADALARACEENPDYIFDFATLTGAARVAVGTDISALFTNRKELALELMDMGEKTHDPIWPLPLYSGYDKMLDSSCADLVNSSPTPYAGAITAALFLQKFVEQGIPWCHFDIMAWNPSSKPGKPEGGEAMAMLAVGYLLKKMLSS